MYTALQIANWFRNAVDRGAGDTITHLKLQKLVYYAQAWSLALLERPLFHEDVQAWTHGPVAPSVWHYLKDHGWDALPPADEAPELDPETEALLWDVMGTYGEHSAKSLEDLTHSEEPWIRARGGRAHRGAVGGHHPQGAHAAVLHGPVCQDRAGPSRSGPPVSASPHRLALVHWTRVVYLSPVEGL